MTTLSENALAFSVDQLLGKSDKQKDTKKRDKRQDHYKEELCASMGEEPACCHRSSIEIMDADELPVRVELCQPDLWEAFHRLGTEMIITKTGRRMFPAVRVRISGLKKAVKYKVHMEFVCVDKHKYRYVYHSSKWMVSGIGESLRSEQWYQHPDSPMTGDFLTSQVISFEKIKLTNNERPSTGQISLMSMQKFQPRIVIQEVTSNTKRNFSVTFPQTAFIAVTAYQNQEITRLKIARNPFAKGFREAGKCRSSLEAMMASFGVVINPGNDEHIRKRHVSDDVGSFMESTPTKRPYGMWLPSYGSLPGAPTNQQLLYTTHAASLTSIYPDNHISGNNLDGKKSDINTHSSVERDNSKHPSSTTLSPSVPHAMSSQSSQLHPAFMSWPVYGQNAHLFDHRQLASLYPGLMYNPLTSAMYQQIKPQVVYDARTFKSLGESSDESNRSSSPG